MAGSSSACAVCCEVCSAPAVKVGKRWQQADSGPLAGWDVITYACQECEFTWQRYLARD